MVLFPVISAQPPFPQEINLLEIHKKYIKLWGEQIIYTVISRFAEPSVKNKITNLGIKEDDILKIINPKYQGAQFYLKQELNKIAQDAYPRPSTIAKQ